VERLKDDLDGFNPKRDFPPAPIADLLLFSVPEEDPFRVLLEAAWEGDFAPGCAELPWLETGVMQRISSFF
jgi:hypothetical protein